MSSALYITICILLLLFSFIGCFYEVYQAGYKAGYKDGRETGYTDWIKQYRFLVDSKADTISYLDNTYHKRPF